MYIDTRHFLLMTGECHIEHPPKLYMDFWIHKANLLRNWRDCNTFYFSLGLFKFHLAIHIMWNHIERERNTRENETHERMLKFIFATKDDNE